MIEEIILALIGVLFFGFAMIFVLVWRFTKPVEIKKDLNFTPSVSIVIPTMNEGRVIEKRIQNILQMDYPQDKLEVIFIDNSKDETTEIITKYAQNYRFLKLFKQEKKGFNNALNQGYSTASGEIVVKSDCTAMPYANALREIVSNFTDQSVGAVCGVHEFKGVNEGIEKEFKGVMYRVQIMESYFHSSLISHGSFGAYRNFLTPVLPAEITADDSEVVINVVRHGYRAIIDPAVKSEEEVPGFSERRSQKNRRAAGVIRVLTRNLDMFFNHKYGNFGMLTMPVDFFLLVLSPLLLFTLLVLWLFYIAINPSMSLFVATIVVGGFAGASIAISTKVRAVADTYISCFIGVFQSFQKKKTWKNA